MRALEEGTLRPTPEVVRHLDLCLGCRACETACPSGVPYGSLIEAARPFVERHRSWARRLGRRALVTLLTTRAGRKVAFGPLRLVAGRRALGRLASRLPGRWLALAAAVAQTANGGPLPTAVDPPGRARGTAALLTGCVAESVFPATNLATARLLAHAGVRVLVPPRQGCCGALALHLGAAARARALARKAARELAARGAARPAGRHPGRPSGRAGRGRHVLRERRHLQSHRARDGRPPARAQDRAHRRERCRRRRRRQPRLPPPDPGRRDRAPPPRRRRAPHRPPRHGPRRRRLTQLRGSARGPGASEARSAAQPREHWTGPRV